MLRLLDEVTYDGRPVTGDRSQALLATLVSSRGQVVSERALAEALWGLDDQPATPGKALQVVVSRTRSQTLPTVVVRAERGYRLGLGADDVDVACLVGRVHLAQRAEAEGGLTAARDHARAAVAVQITSPGAQPPALAELRAEAKQLRDDAVVVLGRTSSALGEHEEALTYLAGVVDPDEATFAARLRSEAAVHGAPQALALYERHREGVRDALGVDPGPTLQAVHATLLAADNPVREGVLFESTSLVGRDGDVRALRAAIRESRVVSILGPGGLGKTRLAHLLGREAEQPVVHFIELVGVVDGDDVVGEIGSVLGVRDSVAGRRVLTLDQRSDVRARIATHLDSAPTLLILDNCEHVIGAVAELVAFLVAQVRGLRVVTTTRAPLAISAERVFPLAQLDSGFAAELFCDRARAARPDVPLPPDVVTRIVERLDGLPLAIELAAAKVRAMSVDDVDRRLDNRFTLLRGADRGAPDRHQTLLAVIDWSWNLLDEPERAGLRRLSVFHDGFALPAAEELLGADALDVVESLVGQSLLAVREHRGRLRYRMLETVREFGRMQLVDAGEDHDARLAMRRWAVGLSEAWRPSLFGGDQVASVRAIAPEENNLADVLRELLVEPDPDAAVVVLATLGRYWTVRGEHPRVITLLGAVEDALTGWEPSDELIDTTTSAAAMMVMNTSVIELPDPRRCRELLVRYAERSSEPGTRAMSRLFAVLAADGDLMSLADDPDRHVAMLALQWASHTLEGAGDPAASLDVAQRGLALWQAEDGPWIRALLDTHVAGLYAQLGELGAARRHAEAGMEVLDALEAVDDVVQLRAVLATAALVDGDLDRAEQLLDDMARFTTTGLWGGTMAIASTRAELALARGDAERGLADYATAVLEVRGLRFPGMAIEPGFEPWVLYLEAGALTAFAWHGTGEAGAELHAAVMSKIDVLLDPVRTRIDYPVAGCVIFALAAWRAAREQVDALAVDLFALAYRFGYNRFSPSLAWERAHRAVDPSLPGALDAAVAGYGDRKGPDVLADARTVVAALSRE